LGIVALGPAASATPPKPSPALVAPPKPVAKARNEGPRPDVARLRTLVEAGERCAQERDWDGATTRSDEAEVLVADWAAEAMELPEVAALLARLQELEQHLPDSEVVSATPDPGLKETAEVVPLSGEALRAELEQVKSGEAGAVFDFPIDLNDKVLAWVHEFTTSKRGFMERTLNRATQWLPMARQIFAEEGIPQDLAYLAVIESGFINSAHSYAQAVGMWQFIRSTGRIYGLNGNAWVEERRDPVKATRASARYLRRLYEISGDWYLALVGYNAGPLTTDRAIQNLGTRNFWDMHRSRWLRNQTKNYVPELCAAILIGHYPERYGFKVDPLPPYAYETVDVDRMTSLAVLARFAGTDVDSLKELNPELLRASTPPGHYGLRVPPGLSGATARALARIPASQRLDFKSYKIRKGDTLAKVAAKFNLSPEDLLEANDLKKAQFKAGRTIKVPPPPPSPIDNRDLLPPVERAQVIEDRPLEALPAIPGAGAPEAPKAAEPAKPAPEEAPKPAPVQDAKPAPVEPRPAPVEEVPEPRTAPADLPPVPQAVQAPAPAPAPRTAPAVKPSQEPKAKTHTVKKGETLFAISVRYGVDVNNLKKWNHIKGNRIQAGQRLRLGL
jgi:membrane-bound lytic murein transglycosylase D